MRALAFCAAAVLTAAGLTATGFAQTREVKGHLMDIACSSHASDTAYVEKHDKKCLTMDGCVKSGYGLVTADKKFLKFDAKGNELALDLLKKTDRVANWTVAVNGNVSGETIAVSSIKIQ